MHAEVQRETCWCDRTWSNPTTGKPPFHTKLEQAGKITVFPFLHSAALTQKHVWVWHWLMFQTQEHSRTHMPAQSPPCTHTCCTSPASHCCQGVPILSKWFPPMALVQCKPLTSSIAWNVQEPAPLACYTPVKYQPPNYSGTLCFQKLLFKDRSGHTWRHLHSLTVLQDKFSCH